MCSTPSQSETSSERTVPSQVLELIYMSIRDGVAGLDDDGRIVFCNPAMAMLTGHTIEDLIGQPAAEIWGVDGMTFRGPDFSTVESKIKNAMGQKRTVAIKSFEAATEPPIRIVLMRDITSRAKAVEAIRLSEAQWETLVNLSPSGVLLEDDEGHILEVNPTICAMLGYTRDELLTMRVHDLNPEMEHKQVEEHIARILQGETLHHTVRNWNKTGQHRHLMLSETRVPLPNGQMGILVISTDVTDKIEAVEALEVSREHYRLIVETAQEGIWMLNDNGVTTFVNQRLTDLLGYDKQEILGRHFCDFVPPAEVDEAREKFTLLLQRNAINMDFCFQRGGGSTVWTIVSTSPVFNHDKFAGTLMMLLDISDRKRAEAQLVYEAFHDHLTNLPNRALFLEHLERSLARASGSRSCMFAVLFIDLDRFKMINDSLGHAAGDKVLIAIAERLRSCLRAGDLLARLGGDEFTVLLDDIKEPTEATEVAQRIHNALTKPFEAADQEIYMTASIGIAISDAGYKSPDEVLRDADTAMYRAKSTGKSRHTVFQTHMRRKVQHFLQMDNDLRRALQGGEFPIYYQPIINLQTGRLAGFEANVRWQHPERGLISPDEFIPLAEETGAISTLGLIVLRDACRQIDQWRKSIPCDPPLYVAVNFSARQFVQADLIDAIAAVVLDTRVDPSALIVEITESAVMQRPEFAMQILKQLQDLHIRISIDDFGTGYSSLSLLHRLPCDTLKIDQSFIRSIGHDDRKAQFVPTIITLAHNLGIKVVAEGIETVQQVWELVSHNCEFGQGYYFSEHVDAATAEKQIRETKRWF